jgi:nucleotide-binding universal stress UspA family protein
LKALDKVLLPLRGADDAEHALRFLQQRPFRNPPLLTLFTVLPHTKPPWPVNDTAAEQMEAQALREAEAFLNDTAAKLPALGHETRVVASLGTPVEGILKEAGAWQPDLILMGSRGRKGVSRLVLGSVSHALLHQGAYPLMIFS